MKNKRLLFLLGAFGIVTFSTAVLSAEADGATLLRVYNPNSGEHHYTASIAEQNNLISVGWEDEGNAWETPGIGKDVYRLYNPNSGDHHYTVVESEKDHLVTQGWDYEGVSWQSGGSTPVYRVYNPNAATGSHHYTLSFRERDSLVQAGWIAESIGFYSTTDLPDSEKPYDPDSNYNKVFLTVNSLDENGNLISSYTVENWAGNNFLAEAFDIDGYTLDDVRTKTVLTVDEMTIVSFKYKKNV